MLFEFNIKGLKYVPIMSTICILKFRKGLNNTYRRKLIIKGTLFSFTTPLVVYGNMAFLGLRVVFIFSCLKVILKKSVMPALTVCHLSFMSFCLYFSFYLEFLYLPLSLVLTKQLPVPTS